MINFGLRTSFEGGIRAIRIISELALESMEYQHTPVMLKEVLEYLNPKKGGYYIDGTLGGGGYTEALSKIAGADGKILSTDLDEQAIANTAKKNLNNVVLVNDNFANLSAVIAENIEEGKLFDGFVLDLGLSSFQLADIRRGFSFREDSPLDMSFNSDGSNQRTRDIVNNFREGDLAKIFLLLLPVSKLWRQAKISMQGAG